MNTPPDLVCLSHLRWDFVYQRPQHLMTRAARDRRVYFVELPCPYDGEPHLVTGRRDGVTVVTPYLPATLPWDFDERVVARLLRAFLQGENVQRPVAWVYAPKFAPVAESLDARGVVYDCMDDLGGFADAPPGFAEIERRLFDLADVVFTGGHRLWEVKRTRHHNVHPFPSGVDVAHFARARLGLAEPEDHKAIPRPRLGFFGVLDERLDIELLREVATRRPEWHFVLVGPTAKIDPEDLPRGANLHYPGMKKYDELPAYLAHWDVALLPFARNAATEFISPTKTPEYLAAGVPVVSTDIRDVIRPYGEQDIVRIARNADEFEAAIEAALMEDNTERQRKADALLAEMSWDRTWEAMDALIRQSTLPARQARHHLAD